MLKFASVKFASVRGGFLHQVEILRKNYLVSHEAVVPQKFFWYGCKVEGETKALAKRTGS